jgi:hypothetical protein
MSFPRQGRALRALGGAALCLAGSARAAPCGRPDVDLTFPPADAMGVPSDAVFAAHYASPALYDEEPVSLSDASGNALGVALAFDQANSLLRATPSEPLREGLHHISWPGLRGVSGSGVGRGSSSSFSVKPEPDVAAPSFAGLSGIDWDLSRDRDPCLDKLEDRFVFRLEVGAADDDAGAGLLSLLVFETRDPAAPDRVEPNQVALRAFPQQGMVEVRRPAGEAGETCFAAVVQDLRGNVSGGGERQVCVITKQPPFFDGCALRPATHGSRPVTTYVAVALALGLLRRGRSARARSDQVA